MNARLSLRSLAAVSLLAFPLALGAAAQDASKPAAPAKGTTPTQAATPPGVAMDAQVNAAFADLSKKVMAKSATPADYQALSGALKAQAAAVAPSDPRAEAQRARLQAYIDALQEKAKTAAVDEAQLAFLQDQIIDARMDRYLNWLQKQALARFATREDYNRVLEVLKERGEAAKAQNDPDFAAMRDRWSKEIDALQARAATAAPTQKEFDTLREQIIDARLDRALTILEKLALARGATRAEFNAVRDMLIERAEAAKSTGSESATQLASYQSALADLEKRALNGEATREQFAAVKAQLVTRARAASAPAKQ